MQPQPYVDIEMRDYWRRKDDEEYCIRRNRMLGVHCGCANLHEPDPFTGFQSPNNPSVGNSQCFRDPMGNPAPPLIQKLFSEGVDNIGQAGSLYTAHLATTRLDPIFTPTYCEAFPLPLGSANTGCG